MKIRIKGNSIRYRLTRTEVDTIGKTGLLEETTSFGATQLTYSIHKSENPNLEAQFENGKITLYMPLSMINTWVTTERVGYEHLQPIGNGQELYLLIEKDFVCLDNTTEDQSDNYPNPLADQHK